jgi:hypothetical protein
LDIAKIDCILICRAAKNLGIGNKRNSIWLYFSPAAKTFGICQQMQLKLTVFWSATQRKLWNSPTKATQIDCILCVQPRSENYGICKKKLLQCRLSSRSVAQRKF